MTQPPERASERYVKRLTVTLVLVVVYAVVQVVAAFATGSLSLLSDAGHMGTDSLGLAMALAAIVTAARASRGDRGDHLRTTWGLARATLQVEPESHRECVEETW